MCIFIRYRLDELNRVVRVDFSGIARNMIDPLDEAYLCQLFDRPDITVIIKGLAEVYTHLSSLSLLFPFIVSILFLFI